MTYALHFTPHADHDIEQWNFETLLYYNIYRYLLAPYIVGHSETIFKKQSLFGCNSLDDRTLKSLVIYKSKEIKILKLD